MKKVRKTGLLATAAFVSMFASNVAYSCPDGEICGLNLEINDDKVVNIEGLGGIDISGITVTGNAEVSVDVPTSVQNVVEFSQTNIGNIYSDLNYKGQWIAGDFSSQVASIANSADIELDGDSAVEAAQDNSADVTAYADFELNHLVEIESIDLDVTAVANNANISDGNGNSILDISQNNTGHNVTASLDAVFNGQQALTQADIDINVSAIGNNVSAEDGFIISSIAQHNCADITAVADIEVNGMRDPINVTAVGNNLQISRVNVGN
ncbi:MAG: hypothetical protein PQ612_02980 [Rickettsiales bacterium]|nr:hypothetical protein [Pseudomonadota bacterium]MDA0965924.1 hypothetical protein [Pseudomonadota bacterium]MDG4542606.1 hypothetical protein [Rickettsiales bacterium]MDG4545110.1 hypothetical protein [Rickettsiales bacterium]MDG4547233.1 hypothetical protein [Rickettsiales bacterium]